MTTDLIPHLRAMVAFSAGRMSKAELALVLGAGKDKGRGNTGRDTSKENADAETKAPEQRRIANARDRRCAVAPQHAKEKRRWMWALCGMEWQTNWQNSIFTDMMLQDTKYEDVYWLSEISDSCSHTIARNDVWMVRSKADTQHGGGGEAGKRAVQDLVDCGRYATRTIKAKGPDGRKIEIQEVNISEEMEANENATLWKDWFWC